MAASSSSSALPPPRVTLAYAPSERRVVLSFPGGRLPASQLLPKGEGGLKLKVKENGIPVPDPEWESSAFGMHSDTIEIAQPIANKEIDAAIQRDAKYYDWD